MNIPRIIRKTRVTKNIFSSEVSYGGLPVSDIIGKLGGYESDDLLIIEKGSCGSFNFSIWRYVTESDEEYNERVIRIAEAKNKTKEQRRAEMEARELARERAEYERLKAKFG